MAPTIDRSSSAKRALLHIFTHDDAAPSLRRRGQAIRTHRVLLELIAPPAVDELLAEMLLEPARTHNERGCEFHGAQGDEGRDT